MNDVVHIPDESLGRDENDDVMYALCGRRMRLGDMKHWFGMLPEQINCSDCLQAKEDRDAARTVEEVASTSDLDVEVSSSPTSGT